MRLLSTLPFVLLAMFTGVASNLTRVASSLSADAIDTHNVVLLPVPDPCKCLASQDLNETHASDNCNVNTLCVDYSKTTSGTMEHGRCHHPPNCSAQAKSCSYQKYTVDIVIGDCADFCCDTDPPKGNGCMEIDIDGESQDTVCAGQKSCDLELESGPKSCGSSNTLSVLSVTCPVDEDLELELTAVFRCAECPENS